MSAAQHNMERNMLDITYKARKTNNGWPKKIEEGHEQGGELNYKNTGARWTGAWEQDTGSNVLRLSSCSGLIMAEEGVDAIV